MLFDLPGLRTDFQIESFFFCLRFYPHAGKVCLSDDLWVSFCMCVVQRSHTHFEALCRLSAVEYILGSIRDAVKEQICGVANGPPFSHQRFYAETLIVLD